MEKIEFKDLPDTTTPLSASNLNTMQDNIEEAINVSDIYSTDEIVIGKWINGKPIYRKVIATGNLTNNSAKNIPHGIDNVEQITQVTGFVNYNTTVLPLPYNNSFGNISYGIAIHATTSLITIYSYSDFSTSTGYIILEYTKTTD